MNTRREGRRGRFAVGFGLVGAAAAVAALATPAQAAEGQIRLAGTANAVADSYIVVLKDSLRAAEVSTRASTLASRFGGQVGKTYDSALDGFSVHMGEAQAKKLAADSSVAYVQANQRFHVDATASWGLDRIDQADLPLDDTYRAPSDGAGVTAYIVDTGINAAHEAFGDRVKSGFDAVDDDSDPDDENGHGTHVAGTVGGAEYGVAPGVDLVGVRVLDADGSGTTEGVVAGIDWVTENHSGPSVANMSLGGGVDEALDSAVRGAISSGVVFAVAAGNSGDDAASYSPARVGEAITVAASDIDDAQADFSNHGDVVDIYAPGVDITSSWIGGSTATNTISGTSMATPHVTGAAALYLAQNPGSSPAEVADGLTGAATPDKITNATAGTPNLLLNVG
ncbi:S8 family peptidase [Actinokineospora spheciospongiae]|uniref:S8 family peptidase n=1 Tax=Actinokineospora spheciospongiae TaxID=909613 RepID=UPI000D70CA62|nr:S8 family peptidase [Actinokineospora spheciospongiae]PWW56225.1 subtilisin family serine protease [Actinokineospora spheciospongiae]